MKEQEFYLQHGKFSHPQAAGKYLKDLPQDIESLCKITQNIHRHYSISRDMSEDRRAEMDTRYMPDMLEQIHQLDTKPLLEPRSPENRLIGCCRDVTLLFVTMARHVGIPARSRVGFADYLHINDDGFKSDHVVGEVWDKQVQRWRLVDPGQSETLIVESEVDFDVTDIPRDRFIVGGQAWLACRTGKDDPQNYGANPNDDFVRGWWFIRSRMIHDLATLNRMDMLIWDYWGIMHFDYEPTSEEQKLLDKVARATLEGNFVETQALYQRPEFIVPQTVISYSPIHGQTEVTLQT